MFALSPKGHKIVGTVETVGAVAYTIPDSFSRQPCGEIDFDHAGDTKIWWDEIKTLHRLGEPVFLDELGNECLASELVLVENDPED